jgi:hypothetical protein
MSRVFGQVGVFLCSLLCLGFFFFNILVGEGSLIVQSFSMDRMALAEISEPLSLGFFEGVFISDDASDSDFISSSHVFLPHFVSVGYQRFQSMYLIGCQSEVEPTAVLFLIDRNYIPFECQRHFGSVCDFKGKLQVVMGFPINKASFEGFSDSFNSYPLTQSGFLNVGTRGHRSSSAFGLDSLIKNSCKRESSYQDEYAGKYYVGLVPPILLGENLDDYVLLFMFGCFVVAIPFGAFGMFFALDGRRGRGLFFIFLAVLCVSGAVVSGILGCLPWNWWTCLHDGQEHSQKQEFQYRQAALLQNTGSIPSSCVS